MQLLVVLRDRLPLLLVGPVLENGSVLFVLLLLTHCCWWCCLTATAVGSVL